MRTESIFVLPIFTLMACCPDCPKSGPCPEHHNQLHDSTCCTPSSGLSFKTGAFLDRMANETEQADLAVLDTVTTVECVDGHLRLHAFVVGLHEDDCSRCSKIIVGLPPEVEVLAFSATGDGTGPITTWKSCYNAGGQNGMITVDVPGYICVDSNNSITAEKTYKWDHAIEIICDVAPSLNKAAQCKEAFSVYAMSTVPDPKPNNNYWWWKSPENGLSCSGCDAARGSK